MEENPHALGLGQGLDLLFQEGLMVPSKDAQGGMQLGRIMALLFV